MSKIFGLTKKAFINPAIFYVISRYATYIIQFVNSLFIAVYLGPYYLGIWGFINLVLGYLAQINFGIPHSVNIIVSVNKEKEEYAQKVIGNGLTMILGLSK
jgi:O-antigen/teichoic acid export membrane protein